MAFTSLSINLADGETARFGAGVFSCNPAARPGSALLAGVVQPRSGVGGQLAAKLALESFSAAMTSYHASREALNLSAEDRAMRALEYSLGEANRAVFELGSQLSADGRVATSLIALTLDHGILAAARVGSGGIYLFRSGELFSFFETNNAGDDGDPTLGVYIGAHEKVQVELSTLPAAAGDFLFLLGGALVSEEERILSTSLGATSKVADPALELSHFCAERRELAPFCGTLRVGYDVFFLTPQMVAEDR